MLIRFWWKGSLRKSIGSEQISYKLNKKWRIRWKWLRRALRTIINGYKRLRDHETWWREWLLIIHGHWWVDKNIWPKLRMWWKRLIFSWFKIDQKKNACLIKQYGEEYSSWIWSRKDKNIRLRGGHWDGRRKWYNFLIHLFWKWWFEF